MNGTDIRRFATADFRRQIGVVFQDFGRYNMSVADNIRLGNIDRPLLQHDLEAAAKSAGAHDFIEKLPDGYTTMMGRIFEDGQEISTGQWQKLAIARAFYSPARFLIFDEATSALDVVAEKDLFQSFRERLGNRGALIISHRMSAIKHADHIYVLSGGRIMLSGTYDELFPEEGDYAQLLKTAHSEVESINP
jgi:ATP-binding cassette subfamily B protein